MTTPRLWIAVALVVFVGARADAGQSGSSDPACRKSTASASRMTSSGRLIHVDTFPAGVEIQARYLPYFDDDKDGRIDGGDVRFRDSIGFRDRDDPRAPVRTPRESRIKRVYLSARGASLDRWGRRPVKVYALRCFGMAQPVEPRDR
ncbi:hypothetical protein [Caulobacter segnis]|jgi:hypothetical protein|uniref:hypothetical protein n=1 Tax=Caulobacter segnis TaxID=88688 RepID=UPI001CBC9997|nr:hypothetical protein [Caulobacter segnis]UAL10963.1 hypothetical protein K8940_01310 [Caulobacter segnis]